MGYLLITLLPDLDRGGFIMCPRVIRISELIEHLCLALGVHRFGQVTRFNHTLFFRDQDDVCAKCAHGSKPLLAHVIRHDQGHTITAHRRHHGECNTGVTTGRFDKNVTGLYFASRFCPCDHAVGRPVLDRSGWIIALQLNRYLVIHARVQTPTFYVIAESRISYFWSWREKSLPAKYAVCWLIQLKLPGFKPGFNVDHAAAIAGPDSGRVAQDDRSALNRLGQ